MAEIKHVLCPIDFSDVSRHAFDRAVALARGYNATVSVLHVLPLPSPVPAVPYGPEGPGPFGLQVVDRDHVLGELPRFLALGHDIGVPVEYHVTEAPAAHKEVALQANRLRADLVVMGTHGRSGFDRLMLGSVAEKVLRSSPVPVMTVPPHAPEVAPAGRDPFRHILYATDFSGGSDVALRYAASFAQHAAARLTTMHVVEPLAVGYDPIVGASFDIGAYHASLEREATRKLRGIIPESIRLACDTEDIVVSGKPYVEILRVATDRQCDLIVMGVHGRNALDRLVFGSTTEHIVRRATCPVLTVRAADPGH
jgi:nucleotide-binding universal stress UspA family protein